jgi:hypothetical protein
MGFVVDKVALGQVSSEFFGFPLSIYHFTVALQTRIIWEVNNISLSDSSSETWSHPINNIKDVTPEHDN